MLHGTCCIALAAWHGHFFQQPGFIFQNWYRRGPDPHLYSRCDDTTASPQNPLKSLYRIVMGWRSLEYTRVVIQAVSNKVVKIGCVAAISPLVTLATDEWVFASKSKNGRTLF